MTALGLLAILPALLGAPEPLPSPLWGEAGEHWDPRGRLPNASWAGYGGGDRPIPEGAALGTVFKASDYGAVPDDALDDSAALQMALNAAGAAAAAGEGGGVVQLDAGSYIVAAQLKIQHSNVVLSGVGSGQAPGPMTEITFPNALADLFGPAIQWSFSGGLIEVAPPSGPIQHEIAKVAEPALRGDWDIVLDALPDDLKPGDLIVLYLTEDDAGSLGGHLHADQDVAGKCSWQTDYFWEWPVRIAAISGQTLTLVQPLRADIRPEWIPKILLPQPLSEIGVQGFRAVFPDVPYPGHLKEAGYNLVFFNRGVVDSWVRDIVVVNADSPVLSRRWIKNITISDLVAEGRAGHHGVDLGFAHDVWVTRYHQTAPFWHALTIGHRSNGCAFSQITSDHPLSLDHHRDAPMDNIFTAVGHDVDFSSGGNWCAGPFSGARSTLWNPENPVIPPLFWQHIQANVVGPIDHEGTAQVLIDLVQTAVGPWFEDRPALIPADLHRSQVERRHAEAPGAPRPVGTLFGAAIDPERWLLLPCDDTVCALLTPDRAAANPMQWAWLPESDDGPVLGIIATARTPEIPAERADVDLVLALETADGGKIRARLGADMLGLGVGSGPGGIVHIDPQGTETVLVALDAPGLPDRDWHEYAFALIDGDVYLARDGQSLARVAFEGTAKNGAIGADGDALWVRTAAALGTDWVAPEPPVIAPDLEPEAELQPDAASAEDSNSADGPEADQGPEPEISGPDADPTPSNSGCDTGPRSDLPALLILPALLLWRARRRATGPHPIDNQGSGQ